MVKRTQKHEEVSDQKYDNAINNLPGMAANIADDCKVDEKRVKQRTKAQNNNPEDNQQT